MNSPSTAAIRARSFAEILDDLDLQGDEGDMRSPAQRFSGAAAQNWLFAWVGANPAAVEPAHPGFEAAFFFDADEANAPPPPSFDTDEERIAAELALGSAATIADLTRARRAFALRNHPDLFHPALRALANGRMQLANMLLDRRRREIEAGR